ncbi:MAG: hypothetical protein IJX78_05060 [Bacilli bacterium]|nr:hypothetical protein [Bacilli bacterium]
MKILAKTRKSHFWNEDRFVLGKNYAMVIDGATPLLKSNHFNEACWMVNYLKKRLNKLDGPIKNRLMVLSKEAFVQIPVKIKEEDYFPSAGMSWIEWDDEFFYASVLGDCEVTFITVDNEVIRLNTSELGKLDDFAIEEMVKIAKEKKIHVSEARTFISQTLLKHRKLVNKPNGYSAFTLCDNPIINEKKIKMPKNKVKEIYLYSDGFAQSFENLKIYASHQEMFSNSLDLDKEIAMIVETSFGDKYCDKYPRFKKIDDITVIKITM